jgi:hypothetical protein
MIVILFMREQVVAPLACVLQCAKLHEYLPSLRFVLQQILRIFLPLPLCHFENSTCTRCCAPAGSAEPGKGGFVVKDDSPGHMNRFTEQIRHFYTSVSKS